MIIDELSANSCLNVQIIHGFVNIHIEKHMERPLS